MPSRPAPRDVRDDPVADEQCSRRLNLELGEGALEDRRVGLHLADLAREDDRVHPLEQPLLLERPVDEPSRRCAVRDDREPQAAFPKPVQERVHVRMDVLAREPVALARLEEGLQLGVAQRPSESAVKQRRTIAARSTSSSEPGGKSSASCSRRVRGELVRGRQPVSGDCPQPRLVALEQQLVGPGDALDEGVAPVEQHGLDHGSRLDRDGGCGLADGRERVDLERRTADERPVHVGLPEQAGRRSRA